jgi:predicted transcriptional regulator
VAGIIHAVLDTLRSLATDEPAVPVELTPAVPVRRSVTDDHIVCLEDGKKLKMLKRHLMTEHGMMTPEEYRERWGFKSDYPTVTPNYSAQRQTLAKQIGLGRKPAPPPAPEPKRQRKDRLTPLSSARTTVA